MLVEKLKVLISYCGLWWLGLTAVLADDDLSTRAAELYSEQNWSESIKAYQQLLESYEGQSAPKTVTEQAWYRMTNAHIQLKQGQPALKANEKLSDAQQIPKSLVLYQQSQAYNLIGNEPAMWQSLKQMAAAGYSNVNELNTNPIWQEHADQKNFLALIQLVDKNLRPCMHDNRYRQFDFWLGHWEVYGNPAKTGPFYGHNTISRVEQGCLIMEQWQGASGSTGTSMNYYDGLLDQWVQRWVSGGGTVIEYAGGLIDLPDNKNAMQLVGKIFYAATQQQPQIRGFRGTWTPLDNGVVQQFFEESIDGGKTWYTWFNGFYFPKTDDNNNAE